MTGKQYFVRVANAMKTKESLEQKIKDLKECATCIGSFEYDKVKVRTSKTNHQEEKVIRMLDAIEEYDQRITEYARLILEAEYRLTFLSKREYADVIRLRYFQSRRLSWDEIGEKMGYTENGARTIHRSALTEFEQKYLKNDHLLHEKGSKKG